MPIYDYRCTDCGSTYDIYHKTREVIEDVVCPSCHSAKHTRLMSVPAAAVMNGGTSSSFSSAPSCESGGGCCGGACSHN
jgi:putative FmdB family regulatory protein